MTTYEAIGYLVYQYRKKKNLSQKELGRMIGYSDKMISQIETGKVSFPIYKISEVINILEIPHKKVIDLVVKEQKSKIEAILKKGKHGDPF